MSIYLSSDLRKRLEEADDHRCAYCRTSEMNTGQSMTIEHIIPQTQGGLTTFENVCLACRRCNEFKGSQTTAHDPLTGNLTQLFHPRQHHWKEHFAWDESGNNLIGLTPIGRATVIALNMNAPLITATRRRWISVGWHPPSDED